MIHLFKSQLFRRQFFGFSAVLVFITLFLLGAVSLKTKYEFYDRQNLFAQLYRDQLSMAINGWLQTQIANANSFAKMMGDRNTEELGSPSVTRFINDFIQVYTETTDILIIDSNGHIINSRTHNPLKPFSIVLKDRPYVQQAFEKGLGIMGFSPGRNTGNLIMTVGFRFLDHQLRPHVAALFIRLDTFIRIVSDLSNSNLGQVYLIDQSGKFFVMGKEKEDQIRADDLQHLRSVPDGVGILHTMGNRELSGAYTWIKSLNIGILVSLHPDILMVPLDHLRSYIIWLALMAIFLSTFLSFLIASHVYKPIRSLVGAVNSAAEQNYRHNIQGVKDRDLNALIESFNRMRELIAVRETILIDSAQRDSLTQIYNHGAILDQLMGMLCSANRFYVAMADIDHFKNINDTYGHLAGDYVLTELSALFSKNLRDRDRVGRYGGEEFLLILRGKGELGGLFERLRWIVENHEFLWEGQRIPLTISIGWVCVEKDDVTERSLSTDTIVASADKYLYQAKNEGRNRVRGGEVTV